MVLNGPRHVPAMSPDRFGDTVRIIDNVLVKHKRRAAKSKVQNLTLPIQNPKSKLLFNIYNILAFWGSRATQGLSQAQVRAWQHSPPLTYLSAVQTRAGNNRWSPIVAPWNMSPPYMTFFYLFF